jgi:hypothetical protein
VVDRRPVLLGGVSGGRGGRLGDAVEGRHHRPGDGMTGRPANGGGPSVRALDLARLLLDRADLHTTRTVDREQLAVLVGRVLDRHPPPQKPHGRLLVAALIPGPASRSPEEHAARRVIQGGRAPTPKAVAGELAQQVEANLAWEARTGRVRATIDVDGPQAVEKVERLWRSRGKPPRPGLLAAALGWHPRDVRARVTVLLEAGWLAFSPRPSSPYDHGGECVDGSEPEPVSHTPTRRQVARDRPTGRSLSAAAASLRGRTYPPCRVTARSARTGAAR